MHGVYYPREGSRHAMCMGKVKRFPSVAEEIRVLSFSVKESWQIYPSGTYCSTMKLVQTFSFGHIKHF